MMRFRLIITYAGLIRAETPWLSVEEYQHFTLDGPRALGWDPARMSVRVEFDRGDGYWDHRAVVDTRAEGQ